MNPVKLWQMKAETLDRIFYPNYSDNWDDTLFRERILKHITTESVLLDLGAGSGLVQQMHFRGLCKRVCGLDPVPEVLSNPHIDEAKIGTGESIPWPDQTFDVVFADNVFEHLPEPEKVFAEARRTLKPGGVFMVKTPNRFHYVPLVAQLTPVAFHRFVNKLRGRDEADTFPTLYRANSKGRMLQLAEQAGFIANIELIEGRPEYMRTPLLYPFGLLWERTVNRFSFLAGLRVILVATFTKLC
jgi:SAM-dependent methyltransferase